MTKSYLKVVLMGIVALLLCYFNKAYSLYIMLLFIFVCAINAYQLESHYQRMGRFFQREKDNEIKEVEIENKYHEKILSQLIRSMNLPMLFIDKEGKIAFTNQSFRKGFEIPHLKGRYYKDIFVGEMLDLVDQCYVFERPLSSVVKIQSRYYQVESSPVFSDKEHLIFDGTIVLFTDVSKMKEIEDMQKQFLSDVSHELKTPMTSIRGYSELLQAGMIDDPKVRKQALDKIQKEVDHMSQLIGDILMISRLENKDIEVIKHPVHLQPIVDDILESLKVEIEKREITVECDLTSQTYLANHQHIQQLMNNLINNAVKYNKQKGSLNIHSYLVDQDYIIEVSDTGRGISLIDQGRVFERFFRCDAGRDKETGGTGLGLAIVKHIVQYYKGTIHLESELGKGTTFKVVLPIIKDSL
jgi:two-component system phosphate regulon sensor histidine kinase PhoR